LERKRKVLKPTVVRKKSDTILKGRIGSLMPQNALFVRKSSVWELRDTIGKFIDCSKKKIQGNRVGDICYMKHTNQKMEI
jgi:hypothetical protein